MPANFDGTNDVIIFPSAGINSAGPFTFAAIVNRTTVSVQDHIIGLYTAASARTADIHWDTTGRIVYSTDVANNSVGTTAANTASRWYLVAGSKATGSSAARLHIYDFVTGTWTHENGSTSIADGSSDGGSGTIRIGETASSGSDFDGAIATVAIWKRSLSDTEIEYLISSYLAWAASNPAWWVVLDQDTTTQSVVDLSGNGGNMTSRSGSAVSTLSAPIGWGEDLVFAEFVPPVITTLTPGNASLTLTAQTAKTFFNFIPGSLSTALTASAATMRFIFTPGAATLTLTPNTPTVIVGGITTLTPGNASLALTAQTPTTRFNFIPGSVALTLNAQTAKIVGVLLPGAASLSLNAQQAKTFLNLRPANAALVITPFTTTVISRLIPGAGLLTLTGNGTTYRTTLFPAAAVLSLTPFQSLVLRVVATVANARYAPLSIASANYHPIALADTYYRPIVLSSAYYRYLSEGGVRYG